MAGKMKDLIGQRFGRLIALCPTEERCNGSVVWTCKCDCGNEIKADEGNLVAGRKKSCGCLRRDTQIKDLFGHRFGQLIAIYPTKERRHGRVIWLCKCDCGNEAKINAGALLGGRTKSCGCLHKDAGAARILQLEGKRFGRLAVLGKTDKRKDRKVVWRCRCDCGKIVEVSTTSLTSGNTRSCGCLFLEQHGAKNPAWNPELTEEDRKRTRHYPEYKEWRAAVYKRDSYMCQYCKDPSKRNLNAHHIQSYADNLELRTAIENGVTLCKDCHEEFHHRYGRGNNTRKQFEQFLQGREGILL